MNTIVKLRKAYVVLSVVLLCVITALPFMQVVMRNVFMMPIIGTEEYTKYLLIFFVFISAPVAASGAGMITMDELRKVLPQAIRHPLNYLVLLVSALLFAAVTISAVLLMIKNFDVMTALGIPFWLFVLPGAVGFALLTFEYFMRLVSYRNLGERALYEDEAIASLVEDAPGTARNSIDEPDRRSTHATYADSKEN